MSVIQLEIDETLIQAVGLQTVKTFMERQLSLLKVKYLGEKISAAIHQAGIDHPQEVEAARQEAWQEYKATYLKDIV
jgi:hypothetical protein